MEAGGADAPGVERVPFVSAVTKPSVFFAGRPATERTANARIRWLPALLFVEFAIQHDRRFGNVLQHRSEFHDLVTLFRAPRSLLQNLLKCDTRKQAFFIIADPDRTEPASE
jgi:hypothetical protein